MKNINTQSISRICTLFAFAIGFSYASSALASDITPATVLELVNKDRVAEGFQVLQSNDALTQAAQGKAADMAKNDYFAHTSPKGVTPWYWIQKSGYDYRFAGENLATHFTDAESQEQAWMASPKHRENILSPKYQDIGIAVEHTVQNGQSTIIVVQMFGLSSGVVLSESTSKMETSTQELSHNKLVASIGSAKQETPALSSSDVSETDHSLMTFSLMQWMGIIGALIIVAGSGIVVVMRRRILYYKYFHKEDIFQYRA